MQIGAPQQKVGEISGLAILSQNRAGRASRVAKLWGGRFTEPTDATVEAFTASVDFDRRLYRQDIAGSVAHATMLAEVGVLDGDERDAIVAGLRGIESDIDAGRFEWSSSLEDVHMNIEAAPHRTDRRGGEEAPHRAVAQRPGSPPISASTPGARRTRSSAALRRLRGTILDLAEREVGHGDARLHPPPGRPADHVRPPRARLARDARARHRALRRCAAPDQPPPSRRGGPRGHELPHRPPDHGPAARVRGLVRQLGGCGERPGLSCSSSPPRPRSS